ncbi:MAG: TetR/AcrR family transcriptional regulator [Promicromonosporaceae bacterium]|nr:TetR/AcrR family transcriptional regulator [Promicromonosporaceae bacterium]
MGQPEAAETRGSSRRAKIIAAATDTFAEMGFHGASLRDIAARAGLSHPGLLHHFPTKAALLEAVLAAREAEQGEFMSEQMARGASGIESMLLLLERNQRRRKLLAVYTTLAGEATSPDHPAHDFFLGRNERALVNYEQAIREQQALGYLAPGVDPAVAARNAVALVLGLQLHWLMSLTDPSAEEVDIAAHLEAYYRSILPGWTREA